GAGREAQRRYGQVRAVLREAGGKGRVVADARGDGYVAKQRDQTEDERVGREEGRVALHHVSARGAEDRRHGVGIEEQRKRRSERERGIGAMQAEGILSWSARTSFSCRTLAKIGL